MDFNIIGDFYRLNVFTDVSIYVCNRLICQCHSVILAALMPQLKTLFFNEEETVIILENEDENFVSKCFHDLYEAISQGMAPNVRDILNLLSFSCDSEGEELVKSALAPLDHHQTFNIEIDHSPLFKDSNFEAFPSLLTQFKFVSTFAFCCPGNGTNLAALISARIDDESKVAPDRVCLNLVDSLSKLFKVPLASIFESSELSSYFNERVKEVELLVDHSIGKDVEQMKLQQKVYTEVVSKVKSGSSWKPIMDLSDTSSLSFSLTDLNQLESITDVVVISSQQSHSLKIQSCFHPLLASNDGASSAILHSAAAFCGLTSGPMSLFGLPTFKAMVDTHITKHCQCQALKDSNDKSKLKPLEKIKATRKKEQSKTLADLRCPHEGCSKVFTKKASYNKHVNYFHLTEGSGVPCELCGVAYQNCFYLKGHMRQAHEPVTCKTCQKICIGENELGRHQRKEHLSATEHICETCGQGFKLKHYLKRHKRQHHPQLANSPYFCVECNRHFGTNRKLKDHTMGAHLKMKPYKCRAGQNDDEMCDKAFFNVNLRRKHEKKVHQLQIFTPSGTKSSKIVDIK